jgi:hypothetical protein
MAQSIPGIGTSRRPAAVIAPLYNAVFLAWRGEGDDQRLFWTKTEQVTPDASSGLYSFNPSPQAQVVFPGGQSAASFHSPALAYYQGFVYMAWKGDSDDAIYWSVWEGENWTKQIKLPALTDIGPALVGSEYGLFLVFRGHADKKIWWAMLVNEPGYDGNNFTILGPIKVGDKFFETSATPSLTTDGKSVKMAWNSADGTTLLLAKCAYTPLEVTISPPGTLPATGGLDNWGTFQWESEETIPPYVLEQGQAGSGESWASGAGPSITGPAVVEAGTGIYIGWVSPGQWNQPYLGFSCRIASAPNDWQSGSAIVGIGPLGDTTPAFITAFCPDGLGATPIYFFKGLYGDPNIYYDCTEIVIVGGEPSAGISGAGSSSGESTGPLHGSNPG